MKKFLVSITEANYGSILVEAHSKEDAEKSALEIYFNGETHWTNSEITGIDIEEQ